MKERIDGWMTWDLHPLNSISFISEQWDVKLEG